MRQRNFLRLVNIKNENIFNQARRNGLESYQPFSGKGRYRTECGRNCTGSTLWADAAGTGDRSCVYKPGEEIAAQIGLSRDGVEPMQELIERDLGPFSGQLVKDKKEYFALAAGDHVEGMEPFADVQKRMERAMELLAATGHQAVAAVSHGAAINVLLAGLTNHEIGTGKTRLYNGAINVIEGSQTGGFHVLHCNLPPDDPKTRQILQQGQ